jgi:5,10-methylene-tetrahydrofolate dehydrogenase/methenyl tetrahydrofolate cyclohydrolase
MPVNGMVAEFVPGPNALAEPIIAERSAKLSLLTKELGRLGIDTPQLDIPYSNRENTGNISFKNSLEQRGHDAGVNVSSHLLVGDEEMLRKIHELNEQPGATLALVPPQDEAYTPKIIAANKRNVEGTGIAPSLLSNNGEKTIHPSTPLAAIHLAEFTMGMSFMDFEDPERSVLVIGHNGQVGSGIMDIFRSQDYGFNARTLKGHSSQEKAQALPLANAFFTATGRPGLIVPEFWSGSNKGGGDDANNLPPEDRVYGMDVGVVVKGKNHFGDIQPGIEYSVPIMYNKPVETIGPMNALTILERTVELYAKQKGVSDKLFNELKQRVEDNYALQQKQQEANLSAKNQDGPADLQRELTSIS